MPSIKDLVGIRFGQCVVQKHAGYCKRSHTALWSCLCDCGSVFITNTSKLRVGDCKSCGCLRLPRLIGQKFDDLTVIKETRDNSGHRAWIVECTCGEKLVRTTGQLRGKCRSSCGNREHHKPYGLLCSRLWGEIKKGAKSRNLKFIISKEYAWKLYVQQDRKCALSGVPIVFAKTHFEAHRKRMNTASLDRIDSNVGYVVGNVQWVHKTVNIMKMSATDANFIDMCHKISKYQKNKEKKLLDGSLQKRQQ